MQQQHKLAGTTTASLLLDTPDPWLGQMISGQYLTSDSKLSLFQTCRRLNENVMQHSPCTSLTLGMLAMPVDKACNLLQVANRHAPRIRLRLHIGAGGVLCDTCKTFNDNVSAFFRAAAELTSISAVTELELHELQNPRLEPIGPHAIHQSFRNLTKLSVDSCGFLPSTTASLSQLFQKLQSLKLVITYAEDFESSDSDEQQGSEVPLSSEHGSDSEEQPDAGQPAQREAVACMQHMQSEMKHLTALRSLTLESWHQDFKYRTEACLINAVAAQLTHLCINLEDADTDVKVVDRDWQRLDWVRLGTSLVHLQLLDMEASDDAMKTFLKMPCLTHVEVHSFDLEESFVGQPCKWQELVCYKEINLKTLAHLPLHGGMLLKMQGGFRVNMSEEVDHTQPALKNVQASKALQLGSVKVRLLARDPNKPSHAAERLQQAVPLLMEAQYLSVCGNLLQEGPLQVLCNAVCDRQDGFCIELGYGGSWELEQAIKLVSHMPSNSTLRLHVRRADDDEQRIIQLCCAAQHKLTFHVYTDWFAREFPTVCEQHIRTAMRACNLEIISLDLKPTSLDLTVQPCHDR